ncbi:MAG: M15 family metallopeptidase [bacterium]
MNRRNFFIITGAWAAVSLERQAWPAQKKAAKPKAQKTLKSQPSGTPRERELLGLQPPELFGDGFNLRKPAAEAFEAMRKAARKDGIRLYSVSSFRGFEHQMKIWNQKYQSLRQNGTPAPEIIWKILEYSSMPGSSRHHWGTDLDLIDDAPTRPADPLQAEYFAEGGIYHNLYQWLVLNAPTYGFYEVYTNDPQRTGFAYEPWHWSYSELSIPFLKEYGEIDLLKHLKNSQMEGRQILTAEIIQRYKKEWGLGVNPALKG